MAAEGMQFPWRRNGDTMPLNLGVILVELMLILTFVTVVATPSQAQPDVELEGCELFGPMVSSPPATVKDGIDREGDEARDSYDASNARLFGSAGIDAAGFPSRFDPNAGLVFDHQKHRAWYRRFWTGSCEGLGLFDFCVEDEGGWPVIVEDTVARLPAHDRRRARAEMWGIGRLIGFEWAKDNNIRAIHTPDIQRWSTLLGETRDAWGALRQICFEARNALGVDTGPN